RVQSKNRWKVVVVDRFTMKLMSSVLGLYDVLNEDVILVESITKSRQPYPDKDAVYFLVPSKESVSRLIADFTKKGPGWNQGAMYAAAHVYFTGSLENWLLRRLSSSKASTYIRALTELYIEFNAIEERVFITKPSLYPLYNLYSPHASDHRHLDITATAERLVSMCATLSIMPYIRYYRPIGSLRQRLHSGIRSRDTMLALNSTLRRRSTVIGFGEAGIPEPSIPSISADLAWTFKQRLDDHYLKAHDTEVTGTTPAVIIILDRSIDMLAPLLHEFTYQAMVTDLLDLDRGENYM
ncbi:syntaxin binding protein 1, partial [Spiromyces aspiralis]